jgi:3-hydroxybutyryl-CoA dehydrogenase
MGDIASVGIVGSGIMGIGLAEVAARAGFTVTALTRRADAANAARSAVAANLDRDVVRGRLSAVDRDLVLARVSATDQLDRLGDCDLIMEAIVEDLDAKRALFAELDQVAKPGALLATNTSTLAVVEVAMATGRPDQVCGLHFFNPAPTMPLVEVVRPITASDDTLKTALAFATTCGKEAIEVADRAGFVVNALLFPYLNSAVRLLEAGTASMTDIDTAMRGGCGHPMGPFALLDLVGIDTSVAILDALHAEDGEPLHAAASTLRRLVSAGRLGRKTKRGFYEY